MVSENGEGHADGDHRSHENQEQRRDERDFVGHDVEAHQAGGRRRWKQGVNSHGNLRLN